MSKTGLNYNIPIEERDRFRTELSNRLLAMEMFESHLQTIDNPNKPQVIEIRCPGVNNQLGAIQDGGDVRKIAETDCVAYVELRFEKEVLRELGNQKAAEGGDKVVNEFQAIFPHDPKTKTLLRKRFYFSDLQDTESLDNMLTKISRVLREFIS